MAKNVSQINGRNRNRKAKCARWRILTLSEGKHGLASDRQNTDSRCGVRGFGALVRLIQHRSTRQRRHVIGVLQHIGYWNIGVLQHIGYWNSWAARASCVAAVLGAVDVIIGL